MQAPVGRRKRRCDLQLSLFVRWHSPAGKTKVTRLQLRSMGSVDCLQVWRGPVCFCAFSLHSVYCQAIVNLPRHLLVPPRVQCCQ